MSDYREMVEGKRQAMLDVLLQNIEQNPVKWQKGWYALDVPYNGATGKNYNGLNSLFLDAVSHTRGYKDLRWVTFNQAKELGAKIKAGERASEVFYWSRYDTKTKKQFEPKTIKNLSEEEQQQYMKDNVRAVLKFYQVFNAEQCNYFPISSRSGGMSAEEQAVQNKRIDSIIKNSAAPIYYDGKNQAYYSPRLDSIHLPAIESFNQKTDYYATALHEISHSTGHPSRLNRDLSGGFGSDSYAIEELRAELASVFMQVELGINLKDAEVTNHSAYLSSWLEQVKKDSTVFYRAAADAGKISDYIKSNYLEKENATVSEELQAMRKAALENRRMDRQLLQRADSNFAEIQ